MMTIARVIAYLFAPPCALARMWPVLGGWRSWDAPGPDKVTGAWIGWRCAGCGTYASSTWNKCKGVTLRSLYRYAYEIKPELGSSKDGKSICAYIMVLLTHRAMESFLQYKGRGINNEAVPPCLSRISFQQHEYNMVKWTSLQSPTS